MCGNKLWSPIQVYSRRIDTQKTAINEIILAVWVYLHVLHRNVKSFSLFCNVWLRQNCSSAYYTAGGWPRISLYKTLKSSHINKSDNTSTPQIHILYLNTYESTIRWFESTQPIGLTNSSNGFKSVANKFRYRNYIRQFNHLLAKLLLWFAMTTPAMLRCSFKNDCSEAGGKAISLTSLILSIDFNGARKSATYNSKHCGKTWDCYFNTTK